MLDGSWSSPPQHVRKVPLARQVRSLLAFEMAAWRMLPLVRLLSASSFLGSTLLRAWYARVHPSTNKNIYIPQTKLQLRRGSYLFTIELPFFFRIFRRRLGT